MKKQLISNQKIILFGVAGLLIFGGLMVVMLSPANESDVAQWFKTNFFPADETATVSILDSSQEEIISQEYKGSTSAAWMLCGVLSAIVLAVSMIYLAKENKIIFAKGRKSR